jgi:hypothetical protein
VLRVALTVCRNDLDLLIDLSVDAIRLSFYLDSLLPTIKQLNETASSLAVRRYAAQTSEYLLCHADPEKHRLIQSISQFVNTIAGQNAPTAQTASCPP